MYQPNTIPLIPAIRIRCISRKECITDNPNTAHKYKRKKKKSRRYLHNPISFIPIIVMNTVLLIGAVKPRLILNLLLL